ncbi:hypothetical protein [Streptomyces sp. NPDC046685]|uniref:hypothetical protein n=1 Tax=Streptomyces sp. NPDC046685 TaxID=3157202 RepID=UPI0033E3FF18
MTAIGRLSGEIATEELRELLEGELPDALPLDGWRGMTLHCQVDAIGPSSRHPDLVQLQVSFPPPKPPAPRCRRCSDRRVVPDFTNRNAYGEPTPKPCPACNAEEGTPQ